ncbi:unnamed protein product [Choristocarpus tenellus]
MIATTWLLGVGGALLAACLAGPTYLWVEVGKLENPSYEVVEILKAGKFEVELRYYPEYLIAESTVMGNMKQGTSRGFRNVAGYIFGNNSARGQGDEAQTIAMTTPVRTEQPRKEVVAMTTPVRTELSKVASEMKVSFVMPKKYTQKTLPKPNSKDVKIKSVTAHRMVAIQFRGKSPDETKIEEMSQRLFQVLEREGMSPKGDLMIYQYHPPFMPGFMRRNEVAVRVA